MVSGTPPARRRAAFALVSWAALVATALLAGCLSNYDLAHFGGNRASARQDLFLGGTTSAPKLVWSPDPGAAHPLGAQDVTQGATTMVGQMIHNNAGSSPVPIVTESFTSVPVPYDLRLNVTNTIGGILYVQSPNTQNGGDTIMLDLELWAGPQFVGGRLHNGTNCFNPCMAGQYVPYHVHLQPEVAVIPAGTVLTLKVVHYSHLTYISYGTKDPHRSFLRFNLYNDEEWTYRTTVPEGFVNDPQDESVPESAPPAQRQEPDGGLVGAGLGLGLLAGLTGRLGYRMGARRSVALLVVLAFGAMAFSGCLGEAETLEDVPPSPQGSVEVEIDPTAPVTFNAGRGGAIGTVRDDLRLPIPGAHVALLTTSNSTKTSAKGHFQFLDLLPGTYPFRVDAKDYFSIEDKFVVHAGNVTRLNITMQPLEVKGAGYRPHLHDYWEGDKVKTLFSDNVKMATYGVEGTANDPGIGLCQYVYPYFNYYCLGRFYLPQDARVLPGTRELEVKITWNSGNRVEKVGFAFIPNTAGAGGSKGVTVDDPTGGTTWRAAYPKISGATTRIPVAHEMTDVGHQLFSTWTFAIYIPTGSGSNICFCMPLAQFVTTTFRVEVLMHKGVVLPEQEHPDHWQGRKELDIVREFPLSASCFCNYPSEFYFVNPLQVIPPGTKSLDIVITWTEPVTVHPWQWSMSYRPGNVAPHGLQGLRKVAPESDSTATKLHYILKPTAAEADAFYQRKSNWYFFIDDSIEGSGNGVSWAGGATTFVFTIVASR